MLKIKFERVWQGDDRMLEIKKIKALSSHKLPEEYLRGKCYCYSVDEDTLVVFPGGHPILDARIYQEGDVLTREDCAHLLFSVRRCGETLYKINKAKRDKWRGTFSATF